MINCTKCGMEKDRTPEFFHRDRKNKDGLKPVCKICRTEIRQSKYDKEKQKEYRDNHLTERQNYYLKATYGISVEDKKEMLDKCGNKCDICGIGIESISKAHVDHDHNHGNIRGILCPNCNMGIGNLKDNTLILYKAIKYLLAEE